MKLKDLFLAENRNTLIGLLAGLGAGAFWGLPFVVPLILGDFNGIEVSLGRFLFFALVSAFSLRRISPSTRQTILNNKAQIALLAFAGFSGYSTLLFFSVQLVGGIISSLIIGLIPITVSLYGMKEQKLNRSGLIGLLMILAGILVIQNENMNLLTRQGLSFSTPQWWGLVMVILCLISWSWYAVQNSVFLKKHPEIKASEWTAVLGLTSFTILLLFTPIAIWGFHFPIRFLLIGDKFFVFLIWTLILGVGSSYVSNWLWSYTSKYLPASISGQLIVSETCFGLAFTYLFEKRFPTSLELIAIFIFILGVTSTISGLRKRRH